MKTIQRNEKISVNIYLYIDQILHGLFIQENNDFAQTPKKKNNVSFRERIWVSFKINGHFAR